MLKMGAQNQRKSAFYNTFVMQNFKNSHFSSNNYKGIVLKIGVQNQRKSAFYNTFIIQNFKNSHFCPK